MRVTRYFTTQRFIIESLFTLVILLQFFKQTGSATNLKETVVLMRGDKINPRIRKARKTDVVFFDVSFVRIRSAVRMNRERRADVTDTFRVAPGRFPAWR